MQPRGQGYVGFATCLAGPTPAAGKKLWVMAAGPPDYVNRCAAARRMPWVAQLP